MVKQFVKASITAGYEVKWKADSFLILSLLSFHLFYFLRVIKHFVFIVM